MEVTIQQCLLGFIAISGQVCAASARIYVQEDFAPTFIEALKAAAENSSGLFGDPNSPSTRFGTIVDKHQFDRVAEYIEKGKTEGTLVTGGETFGGKVMRSL
jgi:aldehyde dehydrogenase (NAD+)